MQVDESDNAIRGEVLATLRVNPSADFITLLENWRYHRHWCLSACGSARARTILAREQAVVAHMEPSNRDGTSGENRVAAGMIDDLAAQSTPAALHEIDQQPELKRANLVSNQSASPWQWLWTPAWLLRPLSAIVVFIMVRSPRNSGRG